MHIGLVCPDVPGHLNPLAYYWFADVKAAGVDPFMLVWESHHGVVKIAQQPAFFDFPRQSAVPNLHYTGPWHRADRDDQSFEFPWEWLDGRPLLYVSMGTLQNRLSRVFEHIIEAVRGLPMQVVLSKGGGKLAIDRKLPENVMAVDIAPQLRLLQRASLAIHARRSQHRSGVSRLWCSDVMPARYQRPTRCRPARSLDWCWACPACRAYTVAPNPRRARRVAQRPQLSRECTASEVKNS